MYILWSEMLTRNMHGRHLEFLQPEEAKYNRTLTETFKQINQSGYNERL